MSANLFMIYQINDLEKSRDYRCRPYEYQIENKWCSGNLLPGCCKDILS